MKKTISVNISGIIFNMDDDAFEKFSSYLHSVKGHFNASDGRDEIMADIEARVAEMFQQKVADRKQVINLKDVEDVITIMGRAEDFEGDFSGAGTAGTKQETPLPGNDRKTRRLYRDPDDRVLGGVCSGIAHYFGIDPLWLRLGFALIFFAFGSGFLLYILLWIIIPQAKATAEKLEMKGEKVNISNISKSIEEEMEYLKKKLNEIKEDAKNINTKPIRAKAGGILSKLVNFCEELFKGIFRFFLRIIGLLLLAIGVALLIVFCVSIIGGYSMIAIGENGLQIHSFSNLLSFFFDGATDILLLKAGVGIILGIPIFYLIYEGIKLLFRIKMKTHTIGFIAFAVWISGWILSGYVGARLANNFSAKASQKELLPVIQPAGSVLYLKVNSPDDDSESDTNAINIRINNHRLAYREDGKLCLGYVKLDVQKSETDSFKLVVSKSSRGKTKKEAREQAGAIIYNFSQNDSVFTFSPYFSIDENNKWRAQELKLTLKVPVGKSVFFDSSMEEIIYDIDNITDTHDSDMPGKQWKMSERGLECEGCF